MSELAKEIRQLFEDAKSTNEFNFVLTLINYRGLGTHKLTTNLYEWFDAMAYYIDLYNTETEIKKKIRIGLLFYSTFQENSDFYNIIGSLCNIKCGLRPSSYLYWKTKKYDRFLGIAEKQNFLLEKLDECGLSNIISFFKEKIHTSIRNNFFHSTYALSNDAFILHDTEPVVINGHTKYDLDIRTELIPIIEDVILFFDVFKECFFGHFDSYTSNKNVIGYFPNKCDVTILGSEVGLQGFKIVNGVEFFGKRHDSGIWYNPDSDMFEGHNIMFDTPSVETIELREQLERYNKKDDISQNDAEFLNLVEKIIERNISGELASIVNLLMKFGNKKYDRMEKEQNVFKQKSLIKYILPFYLKVLEITKGKTDTAELEKRIEYLQKI